MYVLEAPVSCLDVFLFENECIPCTHLHDALTREDGEARCSKCKMPTDITLLDAFSPGTVG